MLKASFKICLGFSLCLLTLVSLKSWAGPVTREIEPDAAKVQIVSLVPGKVVLGHGWVKNPNFPCDTGHEGDYCSSEQVQQTVTGAGYLLKINYTSDEARSQACTVNGGKCPPTNVFTKVIPISVTDLTPAEQARFLGIQKGQANLDQAKKILSLQLSRLTRREKHSVPVCVETKLDVGCVRYDFVQVTGLANHGSITVIVKPEEPKASSKLN